VTKKKKSFKESFPFFVCCLLVLMGFRGLDAVLPFRAFLWCCAALMVIAIPWRLIKRGRKEDEPPRNEFLILLGSSVSTCSFFFFFTSSFRYSYADGSLFPYWGILLILGVIVTLAVGLKWLKSIRWNWLGYLPVGTLVAFMLAGAAVANLNCMLDFSEPTRCVAVIEDKDHHRSRKAPDSYEFQVTVDGYTFDLEVSSAEYNQKEIGDVCYFKRYNGAFGKSYYLPYEQ